MSAPLRYARILNGLSFLISRRSAISRRMRAIAWLSNHEPFGFEPEVQYARAAFRERSFDGRLCGRRAEGEQTPAAAGAAHLGRGRAGRRCASDQVVNRRRAYPRSEPLPVAPFLRDLNADLIPVPARQGLSHVRGGVANPLEAVEDLAVAVEVPFHD